MSQFSPASTPRNADLAGKIKVVLDGDMGEFRDQAREYVANMGPVSADISRADHRQLTADRVRAIAQSGYAALPFPIEYGGQDAGEEYLNFMEILSHGDLSTVIKQGVNYGLFGMSVARLGTEKHHQKYLPDIIKADLLGGFAMTELGGGSNVQGLQTTAIYDSDKDVFVMNTPNENAKKAYIGNAAQHGEMMVVFAQLHMAEGDESKGVHAFLVPVRDRTTKEVLPGIEIEDHGKKIGLNGVDNGTISFDNIEIPRESMLDRFASVDANGEYHSDIERKSARFFKMIGTLVTGRVFVSLSSVSTAKNSLTHSIKSAEQREVFGEALLDMPATQTKLFPHLAETYALHFLTRELIRQSLEGDSRQLETLAAAVKSRASDFAFNVVDEGRKKAGGAGYMAEYKYGMMRNDVDIYRTFEGDNTVLRLLVAKNLLDDLKQTFREASKTEAFMAGMTMQFNSLSTRYNLDKFKRSAKHLLDPDFHKRIFNLREKAMRLKLAKKIVRLYKKHGDTKTAFDLCQKEALALTEAYTTKMMVKHFSQAINEQQDPAVKEALTDLYNLFVIRNISENAQWFLENGFMSGKQTSALERIERKSNQRIRENALSFVDAFAVPDKLLPPLPQANIKAENGPKPPSPPSVA